MCVVVRKRPHDVVGARHALSLAFSLSQWKT
jgi:hypothetical protein